MGSAVARPLCPSLFPPDFFYNCQILYKETRPRVPRGRGNLKRLYEFARFDEGILRYAQNDKKSRWRERRAKPPRKNDKWDKISRGMTKNQTVKSKIFF